MVEVLRLVHYVPRASAGSFCHSSAPLIVMGAVNPLDQGPAPLQLYLLQQVQ